MLAAANSALTSIFCDSLLLLEIFEDSLLADGNGMLVGNNFFWGPS